MFVSLFLVCLCICKSLVVVLEHRKVSCLCAWALEISCLCAWVLVIILDYTVSEISLEVQGGQDYFRFVEGTHIIACVLSFSVLLLLSAARRLWTQSDSELLQTMNLGTVFHNLRKKFLKTQFNPPFLWFFSPSVTVY